MKKLNLHSDSLRELLCYFINGGATTLINYMVYLTLLHSNVHYMTANTAAWIVAVLFAYLTNRIFVFRSSHSIGKELISFVSLRFLTLLLENLLLVGLIQLLCIPQGISKILVSIFTVIGNYLFCKCHIFQHNKESQDKKPSHRQKGEIIHE